MRTKCDYCGATICRSSNRIKSVEHHFCNNKEYHLWRTDKRLCGECGKYAMKKTLIRRGKIMVCERCRGEKSEESN